MTIIIFIIVLGVLILVHEMGHFLVAKRAGVKVDEFGFGYPPRLWKIGTWRGTELTINWIPFGGFVKIFGENYTSPPNPSSRAGEGSYAFTEISKKWQAAILVAGVFFNFLFAWFLLSLSFMIGVPAPVENDFGGAVTDPRLTIVSVLPESPAALAGLKSGDKILNFNSPDGFIDSVSRSDSIDLKISRGGKIIDSNIRPVEGVIAGEQDRKAIGVSLDMVGTLKLSTAKSFVEGGKTAAELTYLTAKGIVNLIIDGVRGRADLSQVTGPVGIVGLVGDASRLGFTYLLTFTALISINLAVINLLPFPALDGGRLVIVVVEAIKRSPVNAKAVNWINSIGFVLLILLMILITFRDITRLF